MTRSSLCLLPLSLALVLHSACGFVTRSPRVWKNTVTQLASTSSSSSSSSSVLHDEDQDEKLHKQYGLTSKITTVNSMDDFLQFLGEDERLCVVKFHASWCKSCQKVGVKYRKLALDVTDVYDQNDHLVQKGRVRFASVEFGANPQLCRGLNIKRLPYIHIYKGKLGKIADFPCGPVKFPNLVEKLDHLTQLSDEELKFEKEMREGEVLGDEIVTQIQQQEVNDNQMDALLERAEALFGKLSMSSKNGTSDRSVSP